MVRGTRVNSSRRGLRGPIQGEQTVAMPASTIPKRSALQMK